MRKIILVFLIVISTLLLASCSDKKITDNNVNVIFYTGANSSKVETYFDVPLNSLIEEPIEPLREGFRFSGWYVNVERTELWDFSVNTVDKSLILFAKWESLVWDISFVLNVELGEKYSSSSIVPSEIDAGTNIYLPVVTRPGGSFKGWSLVPQEDYTIDMKLYRYSLELPLFDYDEFVLYPIFNNNKYLITFQPRMSGVPTPKPIPGVEYGSEINWIIPLEDTSTHKFIGWFSKNGSLTGDWGTEYVNGMLYSNPANTLLYAKWEEK